MISIINLFEKVSTYDPFLTGTARQIGGKGYPTAELRAPKPPLGQLRAKQEEAEREQEAQNADIKKERRSKTNPSPAQRMQQGQ